MTTSIELTNYDYTDLKESLITFLQSYDDTFKDFNFDGSNINTIVSILSRNSHYTGYMANMVASESFLDSAQLIGNVISHSQDLSYLPKSCVASKIVCDITVTPTQTPTQTSVSMPVDTSFLAAVSNVSYSFTNKDSYSLSYDSTNSVFVVSDVILYQGALTTNKLIYSGSRIKIPNKRIDTSSLSVRVAETSDATSILYTQYDNITELDSTTKRYFMGMTSDGYYTIEFGHDILGYEPVQGSIVTVTYIVCEEDHANGLATLTAASSIQGYNSIEVTVTTSAYGGAESDDIETIRFMAPKAYAAQQRCVVPDDYIVKLKEKYSFITHMSAWGGEDMDPPRYGDVIISCVTSNRGLISDYVKTEMVTFLNKYNVGSITPVIIDPIIIGLDIAIAFSYDNTKTDSSFTNLSTQLIAVVQSYSDDYLNDFGEYYNNSALSKKLMAVTGIETVEITKKVFTEIDLIQSTQVEYTFNFDNAITPGSLTIPVFSVSSLATSESIADDSNGNIVLTQVISNVTQTQILGTCDYDTGEIVFTTTFINTDSTFSIYVETEANNVYMNQNRIGYINSCTCSQITS